MLIYEIESEMRKIVYEQMSLILPDRTVLQFVIADTFSDIEKSGNKQKRDTPAPSTYASVLTCFVIL